MNMNSTEVMPSSVYSQGYLANSGDNVKEIVDNNDGLINDLQIGRKFNSFQAALQLGRGIQIIQVTFCLGQPSLTRFIKYPGLIQILPRITCVNNDILQ